MKSKNKNVIVVFISITAISFFIACSTTPYSNRKRIIITSETQENKMGADYYSEVLGKSQLSKNEHWVNMVKRVGERIAKASGKSYQWEYSVIESKEINAWALPGGKIAFYEGIMNIFENEAEIAVVMGHEVGHVVLRHGGERMSQGQIAGILGTALSGMTEGQKNQELFLGAFSGVTSVGVLLPFSRLHEFEADSYGTIIMAKAGYDPNEAVRFWDKMQKMSGGKHSPELLSTHPSDEKRITNLKELMPKAIENYQQAQQKFGLGEKVNP